MAQADGRNLGVSWVAGILCIGVVAALVWLAAPMGPVLVEFVGDTLRAVAPGTADIP
ncbi:hypothetical protein [Microbacterium sp.]|uniref:hypothetical protein n=1 Tax=Microbacterium sp. TaxID=51671 RepID=UPI002639E3DE|nr:hypothetical protein [Microbacterium sp.]